jgi:hypothetical protein
MEKDNKAAYTDFMKEMEHHTRRSNDNGYVDSLVAETPDEAVQPLAVAARITSIRERKSLTIEDVAGRAGLAREVVERDRKRGADPAPGDPDQVGQGPGDEDGDPAQFGRTPGLHGGPIRGA